MSREMLDNHLVVGGPRAFDEDLARYYGQQDDKPQCSFHRGPCTACGRLKVEAEALDWIYKPKAEVYTAPPPTAIKVFYQARREAVVPSYGGTWPL